ncbi:unnamed protein product [Alopecurus aequalis]
MSSFTGVSVITGGKRCTTTAVDPGTDSGHHLLVVKDYSHTLLEIPNGEGIGAGPFMVGGHQCYISYCPNGGDRSCADFISLYLYLDGLGTEEVVKVRFVFSFVDQVDYQKPIYICATKTYSFSTQDSWGSIKFIKRDALERSAYLKDDCFTIRCDIMVCNDLKTSKDVDGALSDIQSHFNTLLQNKMCADVTFEVSGETFAAHRCVLASRSKVFMAQFSGPMMGGTTSGVIHIEDMEAKVFAALLSFIYTDSFPEMDEDKTQAVDEEQEVEAVEPAMCLQWLQDLFVAADRYDIDRLKFLCEKRLSEDIDVGSAASVLALGEQHHCHRLKEACFKFIQVQSPKCLDQVMATDGWEHLTTTYPSVLKEIIAKLASNQKKDEKRKGQRM